MALSTDLEFVLHGLRSPLRKKPNSYLTSSQRTFTTHQQIPRDPSATWSSSAKTSMDEELKEMLVSGSRKDSPSIDELEQSLSELKVQVKGLTETLNPELLTQYKKIGESESIFRSSGKSSDWLASTDGTLLEGDLGGQATNPDESDWFLRPRHLVQSLGRYPAPEDHGVPLRSMSPVDRVVGLTGSELSSRNYGRSTISPVDIAYRASFPLRMGAPHVIGVKALLPPQIPVRPQSPEITRSSFLRDRPQTLRRLRSIRSRSLSPASKRSRWQQSRSQSPKPVWRPSSAKVNACGKPPPPINRQRSGSKKMTSNRLTRSYSCRPGVFNSSSQLVPSQSLDDNLWTTYSCAAPAVSSLSSQEISERFLQSLADGDVRQSLVEMSPYQQELSHLRLQRLRVEEELLLEIKRQQELERIRGPQPKWYEMKGSRFHYEAHKNNELLRNSNDWQSLFNYREDLLSASKDFTPNGCHRNPDSA
ncbi:uncharacterized protein LOC119950837 isoform X1 [Scyliorhinus canicula]|uniref:uncharacterized protein LOC119950837 isoform X1 n=2 Tax=Scyliorhinus canicula TaxID=7830 RepID=UPI0018F3907C|nr:uncharacterized protein LOC119950837 isoform X1 [Scyliorhinus canicula]